MSKQIETLVLAGEEAADFSVREAAAKLSGADLAQALYQSVVNNEGDDVVRRNVVLECMRRLEGTP